MYKVEDFFKRRKVKIYKCLKCIKTTFKCLSVVMLSFAFLFTLVLAQIMIESPSDILSYVEIEPSFLIVYGYFIFIPICLYIFFKLMYMFSNVSIVIVVKHMNAYEMTQADVKQCEKDYILKDIYEKVRIK